MKSQISMKIKTTEVNESKTDDSEGNITLRSLFAPKIRLASKPSI